MKVSLHLRDKVEILSEFSQQSSILIFKDFISPRALMHLYTHTYTYTHTNTHSETSTRTHAHTRTFLHHQPVIGKLGIVRKVLTPFFKKMAITFLTIFSSEDFLKDDSMKPMGA